jgi:hypothetical protein
MTKVRQVATKYCPCVNSCAELAGIEVAGFGAGPGWNHLICRLTDLTLSILWNLLSDFSTRFAGVTLISRNAAIFYDWKRGDFLITDYLFRGLKCYCQMHPCWRVCGKNLNIISMGAVSPAVHTSNTSSCQKNFFRFLVAVNNSIKVGPLVFLL